MFAAQLGLVVWLGDKESRPAAAVPSGPVLQFADNKAKELLALTDPTLFALPHRQGFSGQAWLSMTNQEIRPFAWTEPLEFLDLRPDQLARSASTPGDSHSFERDVQPADFPPELLLSGPSERQFPTASSYVQCGGIQGRSLRSRLELPSWPHAELLSNSVVQVVIDAEGSAVSAILLGAGCGLKEADDYAVRQAAAARFAATPNHPDDSSPLGSLAWGELVFHWHTLPATNTPASKP